MNRSVDERQRLPLASWLSRVFRRHPATWVALFVSVLGLAVRIEHACTFDSVKHGADFERHISGVQWMMHHWRPFDFTPQVNWTIHYQPPLWYAVSGVLMGIFHATRPLSAIAVVGWVVRQFVLSQLLRRALPNRPWIATVVLTLFAFLPISVETDGSINPETLHTTFFGVAVYWLWRMERQAPRLSGIGFGPAIAFGAFAGLGVLTKATAGSLPLAAVLLVAWQTRSAHARGLPWPNIWRRLLLPNLIAGLSWCVVAGWFCIPNLLKYGHPFPHAWDRSPPTDMPELALPVLYRRPLGWALPFEWQPWLDEPMQQWYLYPRPNAWAQFVIGTWSDLINRGFCRLQGGGVTTKFFDGWPVSGHCITLLSVLAHIGFVLTWVVLFFLLRNAWNSARTAGRRGTLALPIVSVLGFALTFLFTLTYPVDGMVSTNARYLLPIALPMAGSLGIGLAELRRPQLRGPLVAVIGAASAVVAFLVVYERWGWG